MYVNPAMLNIFGIKLSMSEFVFYQVIGGETIQVLTCQIVKNEVSFEGKDPEGVKFNEKDHLTFAKDFGSDTGTRHRLGSFNPELSEKVLLEMAA